MKILEVTNLCKTYGKGDTMVKALDNVSFSVEKGEFVAIIGPSGSGKSTLLHILGGVDVPTSGSVVINQTDISNLDETALAIFRRRQIGLIYQFYNLIPILTVQENLTLPLLLDGRKPDKKQIDTLVKRLGLENRLDHLPNQLSGGQQQRVSIARALALKPQILFFDEPTSALDPELTGEILKVIKELAKEKMTMVIVTHEMAFARDVANHVIFMDDGYIVEEGTPEEVFGQTQNERTKQFLQRFNDR